MAATKNDDTSREESTDEQAIDPKLEPLAEALARPRWDQEDYSISSVGEWDPIPASRGTHYGHVSVPNSGRAGLSIATEITHARVESKHVVEGSLAAEYTADGIHLCNDVDLVDGGEGTAEITLTPADAVELAAALCQFAIELDRRETK